MAEHVCSRPLPPLKGWLSGSGSTAGGGGGGGGAREAAAAASGGEYSATAPAQAAQVQEREPGVTYVSHVTKEFNERHVWVDGRGNPMHLPETRVIETQKYATLTETVPKLMAQRRAEREALSLKLWKNVNPGYMQSAVEITQYTDEHSFCAEDLEMAKGAPKNWQHHLLKTDIKEYVEAVARARVFAQVGGGSGDQKNKTTLPK